jgi:methylmalonyl-CoA mutase N-terminal domain/subunit
MILGADSEQEAAVPTLVSQSKIPLKPFYTPDDTAGLDYTATIQDPGTYPYTRGRRAGTAPAGAWIQRELSGEGTPARSNAQFRYLIEKGALGLDVIGDAPTVACLDPDHPFARHAVGTQGVSLCRLQDYLELYDDIPLERITLSHSLPAAFAVAGLYLVAKARNIVPGALRGSVIQAPFYCEDYGYATHMPFNLRVRLALDSIEFCAREMPKFHSFVEDTYYISDGGPNAIEEMALGFVEIRHLVRKLRTRGLDVDSFAPRIAILVNCRMDVFEEVAKIRATRRLFARMMREEFGARDPRSWSVNIAAHTAGSSLTAQQPINNVVRGTVQALALAMAGVQAMEISAFDEAYRTPSPEAHLVGLRTQQVVQLESNVTQVSDPLGGSHYVESLTNEMERRIWEMVTHIEAQGDPAALCDRGWFRHVFEEAMQRNAREIQDGTVPRVGVNVFQMPPDQDTLLREVAETKIEPCRERIEHIAEFKRTRDSELVQGAIRQVHATAQHPETNVMPALVAALETGATMGEIAGALRVAYGVAYDPFGAVPPVISFAGAA